MLRYVKLIIIMFSLLIGIYGSFNVSAYQEESKEQQELNISMEKFSESKQLVDNYTENENNKLKYDTRNARLEQSENISNALNNMSIGSTMPLVIFYIIIIIFPVLISLYFISKKRNKKSQINLSQDIFVIFFASLIPLLLFFVITGYQGEINMNLIEAYSYQNLTLEILKLSLLFNSPEGYEAILSLFGTMNMTNGQAFLTILGFLFSRILLPYIFIVLIWKYLLKIIKRQNNNIFPTKMFWKYLLVFLCVFGIELIILRFILN